MTKLTNEMIEAAISGFEAQKQRLDVQIAELRAILNGGPTSPTQESTAGKTKRKLSPEALKRMREGQQRRWAKVKGELPQAEAKAAKPKRKLSAAGKAAIVAALKKRWAAKKTTGTSEVKSAPVAKKAPRKKAA